MTEPDYEVVFRMGVDEVLSENDRRHWRVKARRVKELRDLARQHAALGRAPHLDAARLVVTVSLPDRRRRDLHNLTPTVKALVDGLVDAGLLPDDDAAHLAGPDWRLAPRRAEKWMGRPVVVLALAFFQEVKS